jgi:hypothetical protein
MSTIVMHNVVSVDSYIADGKDDVGPLFEWYTNGDIELDAAGLAKVSKASADYIRSRWAWWTRWRWMSCRSCSAP